MVSREEAAEEDGGCRVIRIPQMMLKWLNSLPREERIALMDRGDLEVRRLYQEFMLKSEWAFNIKNLFPNSNINGQKENIESPAVKEEPRTCEPFSEGLQEAEGTEGNEQGTGQVDGGGSQ